MHKLATVQVTKTYGGRKVVDAVSISVAAGEIVGLLGPNGAGKTTTFYMCVGLIAPDSGSVLIDHTDITREPVYRRARLGVGYLPQEPSVFRKLTVQENLMAMLETTSLTKPEQCDKAENLMCEFRIAHVRNRKGIELSGGERRRVEIARTLVTNPNFILLDEPFTGIDPISLGELQTMIGELRERGIGVLITDHNVRETLSIVDTAYIVNEGEILISGDSQTILDSEIARKFYLGEKFSL